MLCVVILYEPIGQVIAEVVVRFAFLLSRYADNMDSHFQSLVLRHMPSNLQKLDRTKAGMWEVGRGGLGGGGGGGDREHERGRG